MKLSIYLNRHVFVMDLVTGIFAVSFVALALPWSMKRGISQFIKVDLVNIDMYIKIK